MATSVPLLTVALPTCNGAAHLAETLDSVLAQAGVDFDLLVSDDCSDDETLDLVRNHAGPRARVVRNDRRLGLAGNWNHCVALCETPLIAIVHQDDVLEPSHLSGHVAAFERDSRLGLVCSASRVIDQRGCDVPPGVVDPGGLGPNDRTFEAGQLIEQLADGNPLRCSAVSFRVEAHRDVGGFDPSLRYILDWDFWVKLARRWPVAWLASPTVRVRWHLASETHRFKTGRADLDETRRMLDSLSEASLAEESARSRPREKGRRRLSRAFLNRALDALHGGQHELARECLNESLRLSPRILFTILKDPRLSAQMSALMIAPGLASRLFARPR